MKAAVCVAAGSIALFGCYASDAREGPPKSPQLVVSCIALELGTEMETASVILGPETVEADDLSPGVWKTWLCGVIRPRTSESHRLVCEVTRLDDNHFLAKTTLRTVGGPVHEVKSSLPTTYRSATVALLPNKEAARFAVVFFVLYKPDPGCMSPPLAGR